MTPLNCARGHAAVGVIVCALIVSGFFELQGPHCDIWVYTRQFTGGEEFLCNKDNSGHYHCRSKCHILPLKEVYWQGMGINVTIPAAAHAVARLEYGPGYGKSELYRADCLHNAWHGRLWY